MIISDRAECIQAIEACANHLDLYAEEHNQGDLWIDIIALRACVDFLCSSQSEDN